MHERALFELAIARAIRELREQRHVTRDTVAAALDMEDLEVSRLELGAEPLSAGALIVLLDLFEMAFTEFQEIMKRHLNEAKSDMA